MNELNEIFFYLTLIIRNYKKEKRMNVCTMILKSLNGYIQISLPFFRISAIFPPFTMNFRVLEKTISRWPSMFVDTEVKEREHGAR